MTLQTTITVVLLLFRTTKIDGHGLLTLPSSKNGGSLSTPLESSTTHFALASYGIIDKAFFDNSHSKTPWTQPGHFDYQLARDLIPGHPETLHPCGCNAGGVPECAGVVHAAGFGETTLGGTVTPPVWQKGSIQETAWNAWVNHAGGHIYSLCKKTEFDSCRDTILPSNPAQASQQQLDSYLQCVWNCFESNTLQWAPPEEGKWSQKIQFQDDQCAYTVMDPMTKVGKDGYLWRFTPIPDSLQVTNGGEGKCMWESVTSFSNTKVREEFIASFGNEDVCDWGIDSHAPSDWHVFDKVIVPTDLEEGEYMLSWRWDAYMADQMWTNCADVTITTSENIGSDSTDSISDAEDKCTFSPTEQPIESPPTSNSLRPSPTPVMIPPTAPNPQYLKCPSGYTGLLPHDNCSKYFHCQNGDVVSGLTNCSPGTLFSITLQYCDWADNVTCQSEPESSSPSLTPISVPSPSIPTPTPPTPTPPTPTPPTPTPPSFDCPSGYTGLRPYDDCIKYYHCHNGEVRGDLSTCPDGTLFDMNLLYCNWADQVTCLTRQGCYSNNYKDCNHPHFQSRDTLCHTIWLPQGSRNSCIALWGSCTGQFDNCCEPAICYKDLKAGAYAQCIPSPHDAQRCNFQIEL